jgi:hypothetical protein
VRSPKINSQRAHPTKLAARDTPAQDPFLSPLPVRERMKLRVRLQRYARFRILLIINYATLIQSPSDCG